MDEKLSLSNNIYSLNLGASFFNETYLPQITSYYYDAPISESGDLTPKYQAIKQVISEVINNKALTLYTLP